MLKLISFSSYPREKNSQPPCKSFSYRLVRPVFSFLTMPGNAMSAFKVSLVRFTLRQVGSFAKNYLFARNPQYTKISAAGATLRDELVGNYYSDGTLERLAVHLGLLKDYLKLISSPYCALSRVCLRLLFCFM